MHTLHLTNPQKSALITALEIYLEAADEPDTDAEAILADLVEGRLCRNCGAAIQAFNGNPWVHLVNGTLSCEGGDTEAAPAVNPPGGGNRADLSPRL